MYHLGNSTYIQYNLLSTNGGRNLFSSSETNTNKRVLRGTETVYVFPINRVVLTRVYRTYKLLIVTNNINFTLIKIELI